jgi:hypothetical protein
MALIVTRVKVANFDEWKAIFDTDPVRAREKATGYRILRGVEDPTRSMCRSNSRMTPPARLAVGCSIRACSIASSSTTA